MSACAPPNIKAISADLRQKIMSGGIKVGDFLPTMNRLSEMYGCSIAMVSKALLILINEGLVEQRKGMGTRVISSAGKGHPAGLDAVAFVYPSAQHEGIWRIAQGFQQAAHEVERRMVTLTTGTDFRKEGEIIGRLGEFDVKGAVVYPVLPEPKDRLYFAQMLQACLFPVVLVDIALPGFGVPVVVIDGFHAGYTMTRHLLGQGLRKIGFLANGAWSESVQNRYGGYRWALEEAGLEEQPGWALLEPSMEPDFENPVEKNHSLTRRFLENTRGLEGVVCINDFLALSCLAVARELGLRVPEDLRVVGMDDYAASARSEPLLTTYHVPFDEMGRQAFQMLNRLVQGEKLSTIQSQVRGSLVVRQSG
jgi:DNA-binding LacI/PurR family transcriptional regulator